MSRRITRKEFLSATSKTILVASAGIAAGSVVSAGVASASGGQLGKAGAINTAAATWPWPYTKLDRDDVRKRGHKGYYDGGCCYGAFNALLEPHVEVVGEPFVRVPPQMMYYGGGGGAGWGTLCGALNGAAAFIALVANRASANALIGELFGWYTETAIPTQLSNDFAQQHMFLVNKYDKNLPQTASGSPLCHASVSSWCSATGIKSTDPARLERCARLTGDVAAKSVELLNAFAINQFKATFIPVNTVTGCASCHSSAIGNVEAGVKMDCQTCHKDNWRHLF